MIRRELARVEAGKRAPFLGGLLVGWWVGFAVGGLGGTLLGTLVTVMVVRASL